MVGKPPQIKPLYSKLKGGYELEFSADGRTVAVVSKKIHLWDYEQQQWIAVIDAVKNPSYLDFSPDGKSIVVKSTSGRILIYHLPTGQLKDLVKKGKEGCESIFADSGEFIVDGSWSGVLSAWDVNLGCICFQETFRDQMVTKLSSNASRRTFAYVLSKICREGDLPPSTLCLRDWPFSANPQRVVEYHRIIEDAVLSPTGAKCATLCSSRSGGCVEILDLRSETVEVHIPFDIRQTCKLAWSPDEKYVGLAGDSQILLYDSTDLNLVSSVQCEYAMDVCFSPTDNGVMGYIGCNNGGFIKIGE